MRLGLPALLQRLDGVNPHDRHGAQHFGFFNHRVALFHTQLLQRLQRRSRLANGCQPQGLHFRKALFTQVARVTPAVAKLMQDPVKALPIIVKCGGVGSGPSFHLFKQRQALSLVCGGFELDLFQPRFNHFVGLVAGFVKTPPKSVVGHTALISLLPLLAQVSQVLLHLSPAQFLARLALEQTLGLAYQLLAQLIGTPALPAFQFASCRQCGVDLVLQFVANHATKFFQSTAQCVGSTGAGFAVAFGDFKLQLGQHLAHSAFGLGFDFRVDFGFGRFRRHFNRDTARGSQLVGPLWHRWQRSGRIITGRHGLRQRRLKRIPHHQKLRTRGIQQGRKLRIDTGPVGIGLQGNCLVLPVAHIHAQGLPNRLSIAPRLHRQHFDALRQQHRRLTLHLHAVLQIFNHFDALCQLAFKRQQRLFGQWRSGLCSITLPGQSVGNVELGHCQQCLRLDSPFSGHGILPLGAFDFIQLLTQRLGGAFVAATEFLEDFCDFLNAGALRQPLAHSGCALARGWSREGAASQLIELLEIKALVVIFRG